MSSGIVGFYHCDAHRVGQFSLSVNFCCYCMFCIYRSQMIFIMVVVLIFSIVIYTKHVIFIYFFLNGAFTPIFLVMPESHNSRSGHCEAALPKN